MVDLEANPDRAAVADHEIIEIGACSIENGEVVERFARLVAPTRPLMPEITKLTGLTRRTRKRAATGGSTERLKDVLRRAP